MSASEIRILSRLLPPAMSSAENLIQLMPEALANQIAAGEVVQRPASVVKELLENSVDSGADFIQVVIQDAGKALVQVVDNGSGMSHPDARMAFERHATSKVRQLDDLFALRTFGFRGEALASIAAIAQVTMQTRRERDELGVKVQIAGGRFESVEPTHCPAGTSIAVKNLFFNVPARRNFLKSNPVETRHILQEFFHAALSWPSVRFALTHNHALVYDLPSERFADRVLRLHDYIKPQHLVSFREETSWVRISGVVGHPEAARKSRGGQYFFVNHRYVRSPFLHHAVKTVYEGLLAEGATPFYAIRLELDPKHIDINIHPQKTEIKFDDEHTLYALLHAAVRKAVGQGLTPALDPKAEPLDGWERAHFKPVAAPNVQFREDETVGSTRQLRSPLPPATDAWKELYALGKELAERPTPHAPAAPTHPHPVLFATGTEAPALVHGRWLLAPTPDGVWWVDVAAAHFRIRYEALQRQAHTGPLPSQQLLYPFSLKLDASAQLALAEALPHLRETGFELEIIGNGDVLVSGLPSGLRPAECAPLLDELLAHWAESGAVPDRLRSRALMSLARQGALAANKQLPAAERAQLLADLMNCAEPAYTPDGHRTYVALTAQDIEALFKG